MSEPSVIARDLRKSYDGVVAVDGVSFSVRAGECFGFLGPNGAGKSSMMKMIYGLASVGGGELRVLGHDVAREPRAVKARLGIVPQDSNLDNTQRLRENLMLQARYHGIPRRAARARADELLELAGLTERRMAIPRELSGGMRQRLLIARALVAKPSMIVLDEPTTGLDPQARHGVWATLEALRAEA